MCTNFTLIKKKGIETLAQTLGVDADAFHYHDNFTPGSTISIVLQDANERDVWPAIWWLYLQQTERGLKPHPHYFSVNTNYAKLPQKYEYKTARCIIPATAFVESQDGKHPHLLEPADGRAIAFGGLYKHWVDNTTGEVVYSASIITLPGHRSLENIHRKSIPLWLPEDVYDDWLDPGFEDTKQFEDLLSPTLQTDLIATPIDKTMSKKPIAPAFTIPVAS